MVGPGEEVLLVREPQNQYDKYVCPLFHRWKFIRALIILRNAIQVKNISCVQVGHLPRTVACKLAPLLDRQAVTVEGVINDGNSAYLFTSYDALNSISLTHLSFWVKRLYPVHVCIVFSS